MRPRLLAPLLLTLMHLAQAAPASPAVHAEIDALLAKLQASGCEFNRNGSWYTAAQAKTHLLRKLQYLEDKDMVHTAEQFIEQGASTSSTSGKPYWVKCSGGEPVASQRWLLSELKAIRATAKP
jgi:hypothetical protein